MPRHSRIHSSTDYYHVMMRGNNRESIFKNSQQKKDFLDCLKYQQEIDLISIAAYCLMDNHVHIVVKVKPDALVKAIKSINIKFAMRYNEQWNRVGHVFQDRYKSEPIIDDKYLMQVIRYIHNNPQKANMVKHPSEYKWSSYNEFANERAIISQQQKDFVLGYFSNNKASFIEFHDVKDDNEYLEIKEDIEKNRLDVGQYLIGKYFEEKGIVEGKQIIKNTEHLDTLIKILLKDSKLSHRKIANLIGVNNSLVHKISVEKE